MGRGRGVVDGKGGCGWADKSRNIIERISYSGIVFVAIRMIASGKWKHD